MIEENQVIRQLRGVACKLTADAEMQRDLLQEMFVHMVRVRTDQPGQTQSWYVKSCEFHARNYLKLGRSIDSYKRSSNRVILGVNQDHEQISQQADVEQTADRVDHQSAIYSRDLIERIRPHLTNKQVTVLDLLLKGLGVREIGRQLGVSHVAVIKHRKKIALVARQIISESEGVAVGREEIGIYATVDGY